MGRGELGVSLKKARRGGRTFSLEKIRNSVFVLDQLFKVVNNFTRSKIFSCLTICVYYFECFLQSQICRWYQKTYVEFKEAFFDIFYFCSHYYRLVFVRESVREHCFNRPLLVFFNGLKSNEDNNNNVDAVYTYICFLLILKLERGKILAFLPFFVITTLILDSNKLKSKIVENILTIFFDSTNHIKLTKNIELCL